MKSTRNKKTLKKTYKKKIFLVIFSLLFLFGMYLFLLKPSNTRDWDIGYELLPSFTITDNTVTIRNIRDYRYAHGKVISTQYIDKTFHLDKLEKVWFVFEPFSSFKPVAHTYFVFDFADQGPIAINAEARREKGEAYNSLDIITANFRKYELIYVWGTEQDVTGIRAIYETEKMYMFPLNISNTDGQKLFVQLAKTSQKLEKEPLFYNLLLRSCNNELAKAANDIWPGVIPFHYGVYLPGYSVDLLYSLGFIDNSVPLDEQFEKYYITDFVQNHYADPNFSQKLREYLYRD